VYLGSGAIRRAAQRGDVRSVRPATRLEHAQAPRPVDNRANFSLGSNERLLWDVSPRSTPDPVCGQNRVRTREDFK